MRADSLHRLSRRRLQAGALSVCASLAAAVFLLGHETAQALDWGLLGGSAQHAGLSQEAIEPGNTALWSASGQESAAGPVIADGHVLVAEARGRVRAYREDTGELVWTRELGGSDLTGTPACAQGRVVLAGGDGRMVCLAIEDGATQWERPGVGGPKASVTIEDQTVLASLGFPSRRVVALGLLDGVIRWEAELPQVGHSSPAASGGLALVGTNDGDYTARDLNSGAPLWTFNTAGRVLLSAPMIVNGAAFLLPGGQDRNLYRVDLDSGQWAALNWTQALSDPAVPGPGWALMGTELSTATPTWSGRYVICHVRFDYTLDRAPTWWVADTYESHERLIAIDPTGPTIVWQQTVASGTYSSLEQIPSLGHCPAPVALRSGANTWLAVASSLDATLRFFREADGGQEAATYSVAGQRWARAASPALGNARVAMTTESGEVHVVGLGGNSAPSVPALTTADGSRFDDQPQPALSWSPSADANDPAGALTYEVRIDRDSEVLLDAEHVIFTNAGATSAVPPVELLPEVDYAYRVRARDPQGATSPWSAERSLYATVQPEPPREFLATAAQTSIALTWKHSTTSSVKGYRIGYRRAGTSDPFKEDAIGFVTAWTAVSLEPGQRYEFELHALSGLGRESAPARVEATAQHPVSIGGRPFADLLSALAAARSGDTVLLGAGTFPLNGVINLPRGVRLRGANARTTRLRGDPLRVALRIANGGVSNAVTRIAADATSIERITIFGALTGVEVASGSAARLRNVALTDCDTGLHVESGAEAEAAFVTAAFNRKRGLWLRATGTLALSNSLVTRNEVGLECEASTATLSVRYSAIDANVLDRSGCERQETELVVARATFNNDAQRDLRLRSDSLTIDAGDPDEAVGDEPAPNGARVNLGAFGGTSDAATSPPPIGGSSSGGGGCSLAPEAQGSWLTWLLSLLSLAAWCLLRGAQPPAPARARTGGGR